MGLSLDELDPPLDDVAFVTRSNNRVRVLRKLSESDCSRRDVRDETGISQPTIGRILDGFQERGWVKRTGNEYGLTPLGDLLVREFESLMDTAETIQKLREVAPRLPLDEMDFDLGTLAEATITTPSPTDGSAHFRRERSMLEAADRIQFLCNQAQPETVQRYRDWAIERGGRLEAVIAGDAIDAASEDPEMGKYLRDMVASDRVTIYRYDGPVSVMIGMVDDTATLVPLNDTGVPIAFVESKDEAVREWVSETMETYRTEATRVTAASFGS